MDKKILFRCSSLSDIMTNGRSKTETLGETAKTQCLKTFLAYNYGYYEEIHTDGMMKGKLLESEAISLLSVLEGTYLKKNKERRSNDYINGECDLLGKNDEIYDIKISENIRTFFDVEDVSKNYFCQGQGYMNLWEKSKYKLTYVLLPDSVEMIERKIARLSYHLIGEDFENAQKQLIHNNDIIKTMPIEERIKIFEFDYDPEFMQQVNERVEVCRDYIKTKYGY